MRQVAELAKGKTGVLGCGLMIQVSCYASYLLP